MAARVASGNVSFALEIRSALDASGNSKKAEINKILNEIVVNHFMWIEKKRRQRLTKTTTTTTAAHTLFVMSYFENWRRVWVFMTGSSHTKKISSFLLRLSMQFVILTAFDMLIIDCIHASRSQTNSKSIIFQQVSRCRCLHISAKKFNFYSFISNVVSSLDWWIACSGWFFSYDEDKKKNQCIHSPIISSK